MIRNTFTAEEAALFSGLTKTMLNYLCRTKLAVPTSQGKRGRGRKRAYTFGDVVLLRALARMLIAGISVSRLRRGLQTLRKRHAEITPSNIPATHLVTDGRQIFLQHSAEVLESLSNGQFAFAFVLELDSVKRDVLDLMKRESNVKIKRAA
ncbi:MAG: hypothetical protein ABL931_03395 [Usitatibacteraceae bacterium]